MTETFNFAYKVAIAQDTGVQTITFGDSAETTNGPYKGCKYTITMEPLVVYNDEFGSPVINGSLNNIATFRDFIRRHTRPARSFFIKVGGENTPREVLIADESISINAEGANGAREGISFSVRDKYW